MARRLAETLSTYMITVVCNLAKRSPQVSTGRADERLKLPRNCFVLLAGLTQKRYRIKSSCTRVGGRSQRFCEIYVPSVLGLGNREKLKSSQASTLPCLRDLNVRKPQVPRSRRDQESRWGPGVTKTHVGWTHGAVTHEPVTHR